MVSKMLCVHPSAQDKGITLDESVSQKQYASKTKAALTPYNAGGGKDDGKK